MSPSSKHIPLFLTINFLHKTCGKHLLGMLLVSIWDSSIEFLRPGIDWNLSYTVDDITSRPIFLRDMWFVDCSYTPNHYGLIQWPQPSFLPLIVQAYMGGCPLSPLTKQRKLLRCLSTQASLIFIVHVQWTRKRGRGGGIFRSLQ